MPLPPGYQLEDSSSQAAASSGPPPGYQLETSDETQQPSYLQKLWQNVKAQPAIAGQEVMGALKGAGQTAYNLADLTQRAATFGVGPHLPPPPVNLKPSNTGEQVGYGAERVGEYFIPGGAVSKGAKAIEAATEGIRGGRALAGAGRAALEAGSAGGVNLAQTEDPQSALKAAETAGAVSAGTQAIGSMIPSAERIYNSALKPKKPIGVQSPQGVLQAQKAVAQTGLREGIPVSEYGLKRAQQITDQLNAEIAQTVAKKSAQLGPVIQPQAVASRVEQLRPQFENQVNPASDINALNQSKAQFLAKHTPEPPPQEPPPVLFGPNDKPLPGPPPVAPPEPTPMTLSEAQSEKQGTYTQLRKKYGELGSADTESQKALARGLKEEILKRAPELAQLNARDSSMIELENQLANFVKRTNTKDLIGLKTAIVGGALAGAGGAGTGYRAGGLKGAAAEGIPAALIGAALGSPAIKSRLAIALNRASGLGAAITSTAPKVAAAAPQMARGGVIRSGRRNKPRFPQQQALPAVMPPAPQLPPQPPPVEPIAAIPGMKKGGTVAPGGSVEDRVRGSANIPLSQEGTQEALSLGQNLARKGFGRRGDTITPGKLDRAQQTAQAIAQFAPHAKMLPPDTSLDTWRLGAIEGQPTDQVKSQIEDLINNPDKVPPPGSVSSEPPESWNQFKQRYLPPWKARIQQYLKQPNNRHVYTTHGRGQRLVHGWIKNGMPDSLDVDPKFVLAENDRPADVHRIALGPGGKLQVKEIDAAKPGRLKSGILNIRHAATDWNHPAKGLGSGKTSPSQWNKGGVAHPELPAVQPLS